MYLKRYTIASMFLMIFVGWYVYAFVSQDTYAIDFFGIQLPAISIAVLVVTPLVVFYIASMLHMSFYSFINTLEQRKYHKDYEKFLDAVKDAYLGKSSKEYSYKTSAFSLLGSLINNSTVFPNGAISFQEDNDKTQKIEPVLNLIDSIKNGEVVDLKKYNLDTDNPLRVQNDKNRYKNGKLNAEKVLSSKNKYSDELSKSVYVDFVKDAPLYAIESYSDYMTKEALFEILARVNSDENTLEVANDSLIALVSKLEFTSNDYIDMSKALSLHMIPEQRMKFFETLSEKYEDAMDAYLFTLFDLEMIDLAKEILNISQEDEFLKFKSYLALKECGKNYNIELFV
ncbi:hypothetical protein [Sulfurimonas sp.]|uniref:hypothetical protein n=1 Tax=Sulfurimonas sp. TaxID=2022749 RepID=UPI003564E9D5